MGVGVAEWACTLFWPNRSGQTIVSRLRLSRRRQWSSRTRMRLVPGVLVAIVAVACGPASDTTTVDDARAELLGLMWDVTSSDGYRYQLTDDRGEPMGPMEVIQVGESEYAAVYFWTPQTGPSFKVALATSTNLLDWTWRADLADYASQPTIKETEDGGFVVAWEQEPPAEDEAWIRLAYYPSWDALLGAEPGKVFDAPRQLSECGEGTPNIDTASSTRVEFGFHYYAECEVDRQARGTTDWVTWDAEPAALLDRAVLFQGYAGSIGDRATLDFLGHRFTFLEASFILDDWSSFRVLIYDEGTGAADRAQFGVDADTVSIPESWSEPIPGPPAEPPSEHVFILTHRASASVSNPSLALVELDGRQALVVTLYIQQPGLGGDETGELIYYRFVAEPTQNEE